MNRLWLNACWVTLAALSTVASPSAALAAAAAREPITGLADFHSTEPTNFRTWKTSRDATAGTEGRLGLVMLVTDREPENEYPTSDPIRVRELVSTYAFTRELRGRISGFAYQAQGGRAQRSDPMEGLFVFRNADPVDGQGVEFALERRYLGDLWLRSSYVLQRSAFAATGEEISSSPRHVAKFSGLVPLYDTTTYGGVEMQYQSGLKTQAGNRTPRFLLTSLTLHTRAFGRGIEISATAQNLFNKHYSFPGSTGQVQDTIPQVGRSLRVKLTYRF